MNASLINDNLSYSVPTVVKTFETYAAFNSESPVSIPTDKTDWGVPQACPVCGEDTQMAKTFDDGEGGLRFSGICANPDCKSRWHRWVTNEACSMFVYSKALGTSTFTLDSFQPDVAPEDEDPLWVVSVQIRREDAEPYAKEWSGPASDLSKMRRLARLRIRKQAKAAGIPFSIKDAEVVKDEARRLLTIDLHIEG